jgi:hypothetical protein
LPAVRRVTVGVVRLTTMVLLTVTNSGGRCCYPSQ